MNVELRREMWPGDLSSGHGGATLGKERGREGSEESKAER